MGERAVFSVMAHVFQIDQETKRKWIPSSSSAVRVSYYHDPTRKTYRIIAIDDVKALINSTITANMNFTKTSPKFGQWSDHRANTVYGLGFSSEKELLQFIDMFTEAKQAARELLKERQLVAQRLQEQEKSHPPAGSTPSPTSPPVKSPSIVSPPASTSGSTSKSPSPSLTSPGLAVSLGPILTNAKSTSSGSDSEKETVREVNRGGRKSSKSDLEGSRSPVQNGADRMESLKVVSNGHSSLGDVESSSLEAQLEAQKSENNRLKMALASSSTNVKKWESELQTMKNNNTRLQAALEESKQHLSQWKTQLQKYKEENDGLKKKVHHFEEQRKIDMDEMDVLRRDNEELKDVLGSVQTELEVKTEEAQNVAKQLDQARRDATEAQSSLLALKDENTLANEQITELEDQLKMASVASKRKVEDVRMRQKEFGIKLKELMRMHSDLEGFMDT